MRHLSKNLVFFKKYRNNVVFLSPFLGTSTRSSPKERMADELKETTLNIEMPTVKVKSYFLGQGNQRL
jgi:hypothetical protein